MRQSKPLKNVATAPLRNLHAFSKNMGGNENPLTKWDEARNAALFHMSMAERLGFHVVRTRLLASFS